MRLDANQLQTTDNSLVPNWLLKWYPRRLLPTNPLVAQARLVSELGLTSAPTVWRSWFGENAGTSASRHALLTAESNPSRAIGISLSSSAALMKRARMFFWAFGPRKMVRDLP